MCDISRATQGNESKRNLRSIVKKHETFDSRVHETESIPFPLIRELGIYGSKSQIGVGGGNGQSSWPALGMLGHVISCSKSRYLGIDDHLVPSRAQPLSATVSQNIAAEKCVGHTVVFSVHGPWISIPFESDISSPPGLFPSI